MCEGDWRSNVLCPFELGLATIFHMVPILSTTNMCTSGTVDVFLCVVFIQAMNAK